jgi:nucleotide-binding universal stress UspA family protein
MRLVAVVDGSCWSELALRHACRSLEDGDEVVLLAVSPRGGQGYLECGRMVLEAALRRCGAALSRVKVRTRLEVGDPRVVIPAVAAAEAAAVLMMGAVGSGELPYGPPLGDAARAAWAACPCPILVGSPRGVELLAGEERLLVATRRAAAPRRHRCDAVHRKRVAPLSGAREGGGYNQGVRFSSLPKTHPRGCFDIGLPVHPTARPFCCTRAPALTRRAS